MNPPVVIKVGGSLLDWPKLPGRLAAYLGSKGGERLVLVVGGGRFADALRDLDEAHRLGEARSHALALRVLDVTAHLLASLVTGLEVVETLGDLEGAWSRGRVPILAPRRFLDDDDRSPEPLPHAWTTTTDAIAARVASRLGASEVVLLKSARMTDRVDRVEAARLGWVDPEFPRASEAIPIVTFLNFRDG